MRIEFDSEKDAINRAKHGLSLAFGQRVLEAEDHIILPSFRQEDGEDRYKAVGLVGGRLTRQFISNAGYRCASFR